MESVSAMSSGTGVAGLSTTPAGSAVSIGPYYGVKIVSDAVETTLHVLQSAVDMGVGGKVDTHA